jgi:hypothetical protein
MSEISIDAIVERKIVDQLDDRLPRLVDERLKYLQAPSPWMTDKELADYWQVSVDSVRNWTKRTDDPLPCGSMGEMRRYHRDEADQWARDEAARRRPSKLKAVG